MLVHKVSEKSAAEEAVVSEPVKYVEKSPDFAVELLTVNEYSRPGTELAAGKWDSRPLYGKSGNDSGTEPQLF